MICSARSDRPWLRRARSNSGVVRVRSPWRPEGHHAADPGRPLVGDPAGQQPAEAPADDVDGAPLDVVHGVEAGQDTVEDLVGEAVVGADAPGVRRPAALVEVLAQPRGGAVGGAEARQDQHGPTLTEVGDRAGQPVEQPADGVLRGEPDRLARGQQPRRRCDLGTGLGILADALRAEVVHGSSPSWSFSEYGRQHRKTATCSSSQPRRHAMT